MTPLLKPNDVVWLKESDAASWADAVLADVVKDAGRGAKTVRVLRDDGKEKDVAMELVELACVGQSDAEDIAEGPQTSR